MMYSIAGLQTGDTDWEALTFGLYSDVRLYD
jgi:hypothetical protein